jgi:hypothetical protein
VQKRPIFIAKHSLWFLFILHKSFAFC